MSSTALGPDAIRDLRGGLSRAAFAKRLGVTPQQVDNLIVVSSSGIATPSLDARVINTLKMRPNVRRTPIWGLGCAGGVAGLARAAEIARAYPHSITVLAAVSATKTRPLESTSRPPGKFSCADPAGPPSPS